jgi:hypothetical protein
MYQLHEGALQDMGPVVHRAARGDFQCCSP